MYRPNSSKKSYCNWDGTIFLYEIYNLYQYILRKNGAETQTCTGDARLFRPALYYLSYLGNMFKDRGTFYIRNNWNVNIEDFFVFLYNKRL